MLHAEMGLVTVRVGARSSRTSVALDARGILVRVRAASEHGRATEEARRALAEALGVPRTGVNLGRGGRSRTKVFEVEGLDQREAEMRLRATRDD
jgi:uncharacterized protein YggU (UPF0235/DUF167 family)